MLEYGNKEMKILQKTGSGKPGEQREKPVIKKKQLVSSILTILHTGTLQRKVADAAIKHVVISIRILKKQDCESLQETDVMLEGGMPQVYLCLGMPFIKKKLQALTTL